MGHSTDNIIMKRSDFYFFWSGPFSQWSVRPMVIDGLQYNCCEQFMMAEKARLFGDDEILDLIMASDDPRTQKHLGRKVKGFVLETWESKCRDIVYKANLAKFTQNPELKAMLLATGSKRIVEASPLDRVWGIGLAEKDNDAPNPDKWRGTNWLGEAIQKVREELIATGNTKDERFEGHSIRRLD